VVAAEEYVLAGPQELVVLVVEETDLMSVILQELQELQTEAAVAAVALRPLEVLRVLLGVRV
jgi:hypothetical protein